MLDTAARSPEQPQLRSAKKGSRREKSQAGDKALERADDCEESEAPSLTRPNAGGGGTERPVPIIGDGTPGRENARVAVDTPASTKSRIESASPKRV